jgi:hypothetical protein
VGGQFKGRLLFRNEAERSRARKWGITDFNKIYDLNDLAKGDCIFAATGVTDGSLLDGVKIRKNGVMTTDSVVMRVVGHRALGERGAPPDALSLQLALPTFAHKRHIAKRCEKFAGQRRRTQQGARQ